MAEALLSPWLLNTAINSMQAVASRHTRPADQFYPILFAPNLLQIVQLVKDPANACVVYCSDRHHKILTVFTDDAAKSQAEITGLRGVIIRADRYRFCKVLFSNKDLLLLLIDSWKEIGGAGCNTIGTPIDLNGLPAVTKLLVKEQARCESQAMPDTQPSSGTPIVTVSHDGFSTEFPFCGIKAVDLAIPAEQTRVLDMIRLDEEPRNLCELFATKQRSAPPVDIVESAAAAENGAPIFTSMRNTEKKPSSSSEPLAKEDFGSSSDRARVETEPELVCDIRRSSSPTKAPKTAHSTKTQADMTESMQSVDAEGTVTAKPSAPAPLTDTSRTAVLNSQPDGPSLEPKMTAGVEAHISTADSTAERSQKPAIVMLQAAASAIPSTPRTASVTVKDPANAPKAVSPAGSAFVTLAASSGPVPVVKSPTDSAAAQIKSGSLRIPEATWLTASPVAIAPNAKLPLRNTAPQDSKAPAKPAPQPESNAKAATSVVHDATTDSSSKPKEVKILAKPSPPQIYPIIDLSDSLTQPVQAGATENEHLTGKERLDDLMALIESEKTRGRASTTKHSTQPAMQATSSQGVVEELESPSFKSAAVTPHGNRLPELNENGSPSPTQFMTQVPYERPALVLMDGSPKQGSPRLSSTPTRPPSKRLSSTSDPHSPRSGMTSLGSALKRRSLLSLSGLYGLPDYSSW